MSDIKVPESPLPTLPRLGISPSSSLHTTIHSLSHDQVQATAQQWLDALSAACSPSTGSAQQVLNLLVKGTGLPDPSTGAYAIAPFWRDMLAFTWDLRTFHGEGKISKFLSARLSETGAKNFKLKREYTFLQKPFAGTHVEEEGREEAARDLLWIHVMFDFETNVGAASGIARLVPVPLQNDSAKAEWKAHVMFTNLESLANFPPKVGPLRNFQPNHGKWESARMKEANFVDADPKVLVIGAGQSGLEVAARLKYMNVPTLVVEKNERIGDNWRKRYEALCLHDPVWYDHMPYLPFPPTWPVYTPALKLANWLEFYADSLELDVWTSSNITNVVQDEKTGQWHVTVLKGVGKGIGGKEEKEERKFTVNHIVFCTGLGGDTPNTPVYPGMDVFKGQVLHSTQHNRALDHAGKKVVVVGACTSAHDIAVDYYDHGIDITMVQRSSTYIMSTSNGWEVLMKGGYWEDGPPVDIVDRINASFPHHASIELNRIKTSEVAWLDRDLLESLHKVGFRTNLGIQDTGFGLLAWNKAGGYYLDTGGSKLIAEGKIKLKSGSQIVRFTEKSIVFEDGSELEADVVVFATGLGKQTDKIARVLGPTLAEQCAPLWGLDEEGELQGAWKQLGTKNGLKGLWYMMGNLALCRFHSSHLTLQIKAIEEGLVKSRYED
ncbi:FAD/NAD(P)-binding domain-containing protein [Agrocybe pediades]|nr:FAD/NAD(P)-binding domain-containing protein [Agrocybe pediades]